MSLPHVAAKAIAAVIAVSLTVSACGVDEGHDPETRRAWDAWSSGYPHIAAAGGVITDVTCAQDAGTDAYLCTVRGTGFRVRMETANSEERLTTADTVHCWFVERDKDESMCAGVDFPITLPR